MPIDLLSHFSANSQSLNSVLCRGLFSCNNSLCLYSNIHVSPQMFYVVLVWNSAQMLKDSQWLPRLLQRCLSVHVLGHCHAERWTVAPLSGCVVSEDVFLFFSKISHHWATYSHHSTIKAWFMEFCCDCHSSSMFSHLSQRLLKLWPSVEILRICQVVWMMSKAPAAHGT